MNQNERIQVLVQLSQRIEKLLVHDEKEVLLYAKSSNTWFTIDSMRYQLRAIQEEYLQEEKLKTFVKKYSYATIPKKIGIVCAGNIPLVSFHDWLCVYLSGHDAVIKLSSQDLILSKYIIDELNRIANKEAFQVVDQLKQVDAVIATGSNTSMSVFEKYFQQYPHILRGSRTSCAILKKEITDADILNLGYDIFLHFGLGCRNVNYLWIEQGFDVKRLLAIWEKDFAYLFDHTKYMNNYDYQHTLLIMNQTEHYSTNFINLVPSTQLFAAISNVNFAYYDDENLIHEFLKSNIPNIQCIVSDEKTCAEWKQKLPELDFAFTQYGKTQKPMITDFADGVDTLIFLNRL